jgi:histidyl-tRNA synthetase
MAEKYSIPKGTRDFTPQEMFRRNYIFSTIKKIFEHYGYVPIETPAMENLSTLLGKYGEEGDKLLFKILNSGNYLAGVQPDEVREENLGRLTTRIAEKGLRYDLTVPFARFVVQHLNELTFPFKRYQIQPVWRADKPQKGRYREFYQCDVDVIGSNSLMNEVELVQIIHDIFQDLRMAITVKLNNRKILAGIAETAGVQDRFTHLTVAIDKLEKIGMENVMAELTERGFTGNELENLKPLLTLTGGTKEKLLTLKKHLGSTPAGQDGIREMEYLFERLKTLGIDHICELDITLARGLNYYTGTIFEVKANDVAIGSICGGGRYDDLTGIFGLQGVSGVGISFGADRIYDVLTALNGFPEHDSSGLSILFLNFGEKEEKYCLPLASKIRQAGFRAEIYPDQARIQKQLKWADQRKVDYVIFIGEKEMAENCLSVKNMNDGSQETLTPEELIAKLKSKE